MVDESYEAVTNLGKAMQNLADTSDGLASSFGRLAENSRAWTIASRILSGSGLWKLQNYIRAVGNAITFYEQSQLKQNQATVKGMEALLGLQERYNELGKELKLVNKQQGHAYQLMLLQERGDKQAAKTAAKKLLMQTRQNIQSKIALNLRKKSEGTFGKMASDISEYMGTKTVRYTTSKGTPMRRTQDRFGKFTETRGIMGYSGTVARRFMGAGKGGGLFGNLKGKGKMLFGSMFKTFALFGKSISKLSKIYMILPLFLTVGLGVLMQAVPFIAGILIAIMLIVKIFKEGKFIETFQMLRDKIPFDLMGQFFKSMKEIGGGLFDILKAVFTGNFGLFGEGIVKLFTGIIRLAGTILLGILTTTIALLLTALRGMYNGFVGALNSIPYIGLNIPKLATGGSIASGGMALVGERGPELVSLPTGARVHSNSASRNMGSNIHVHISGRVGASDAEIRDIANKVAREVNLRMNRTGSAVGRF